MIRFAMLILTFFIMLCSVNSAKAETRFNVDTIITGNWGIKEGEFGFEKKGKTEDGYSLDMVVTDTEIYILDAMNNRIQVFDKNGSSKFVIKLGIKWEDFGVPFGFALHKNSFYILTGKPPYYGRIGIREIHKFTYDGVFVKTFGREYISKGSEDFYEIIFADANKGNIYSEINRSILEFDAEGTLNSTVFTSKPEENIELLGIGSDSNLILVASKQGGENRRTLLVNPVTKIIKEEVSGRFSLVDKKGVFFNIKTVRGTKKMATSMITDVNFFDTVTGNKGRLELKGDIKTTKNGISRVYRYSGHFFETSSIDQDGNIYHLIALEDGVIVRKISSN